MWCKNQIATISVDQTANPGLTGFSWAPIPTGWTYIYGGGTNNYITLKAPNSTSPPTFTFEVTATNICGGSSTVNHMLAMMNCSAEANKGNGQLFEVTPTSEKSEQKLQIFPVPASNSITVSFWREKKGIAQISIFDAMGKQVKLEKVNATPGNNLRIMDVSKLLNGVYIVRIWIGKKSTEQKIVIDNR
jgi:hypothetical protein